MLPNAMADCVLPEDIIVRCILTRLPVKPIIRFKSVCKAWLQLFSTPDFVKLHHAQFLSDPKNECFLVDLFGPISLFKVEPTTILNLPWADKISGMGIVGCCNGMVCFGSLPKGKSVILWNPAMKLFKFIRLTREGHPMTRLDRAALGFAYDVEVDDYKVIRIVYSVLEEEGNKFMNRIEVYSVNSDSWITIDPGFKFLSLNDKNDATLNGNPYWVVENPSYNVLVCFDENAKNYSCNVLVCFDVKKMVFKTVPLFKPKVNEDARFVDWNGCLGALVCTLDSECVVKSIDVWVFDEGEQIWKKNHTFEAPIEMKNTENKDWELLSSKNGKIMVICTDGQNYVFDTVIGSIKKVGIADFYPFEMFPYAESLSYIEGMKHEGDEIYSRANRVAQLRTN